VNTKQQAWDIVGLRWWQLGRKSAKPSLQTIRWYVQGVGPTDHCLIIGGTSVGLIRAVRRATAQVTVADFSPRICAELPMLIPSDIVIVHCDILDAPADWSARFTLVCADTLINRFDEEEFCRFRKQVWRILKPAGQLRTVVKVGLYAMDRKLLALAAMHHNIAAFWDNATQTIDYTKVGELLEGGLIRHGGISRRELVGWYRLRGREKRYHEEELIQVFQQEHWLNVTLERDLPAQDRVRLRAIK